MTAADVDAAGNTLAQARDAAAEVVEAAAVVEGAAEATAALAQVETRGVLTPAAAQMVSQRVRARRTQRAAANGRGIPMTAGAAIPMRNEGVTVVAAAAAAAADAQIRMRRCKPICTMMATASTPAMAAGESSGLG